MAYTIIEEQLFDRQFIVERLAEWDEFCHFH